jgi:hypothetical protein
MAGWPDIVVAK